MNLQPQVNEFATSFTMWRIQVIFTKRRLRPKRIWFFGASILENKTQISVYLDMLNLTFAAMFFKIVSILENTVATVMERATKKNWQFTQVNSKQKVKMFMEYLENILQHVNNEVLI